MKILHTSDLHLGRCLQGYSFYDDQKDVLKKIIEIVKEENVEAMIIPGDIYDKSIPSVEAVNLFGEFLKMISDLKVEVYITDGNHDSKERLGFASTLLDHVHVHIVNGYEGKITTYEQDNVVFYMLPFLKPFNLKHVVSEDAYSRINTSEEMMKYIIDNEKLDKNKKNILLAHQFIMGVDEVKLSESESNVGTLDAISYSVFDEFDYVALGHIHSPQKVGRENVRYSGTPLKYSFSEVNDHKSVVIIDSEDMSFKTVELKPLHEMRIIEDSFDNIMRMSGNDEIVKIILTDKDSILSPMSEIQKVFPNAISLVFKRNEMDNQDEDANGVNVEQASKLDLFNALFKQQKGVDLDDEERAYMERIIKEVEERASYEN